MPRTMSLIAPIGTQRSWAPPERDYRRGQPVGAAGRLPSSTSLQSETLRRRRAAATPPMYPAAPPRDPRDRPPMGPGPASYHPRAGNEERERGANHGRPDFGGCRSAAGGTGFQGHPPPIPAVPSHLAGPHTHGHHNMLQPGSSRSSSSAGSRSVPPGRGRPITPQGAPFSRRSPPGTYAATAPEGRDLGRHAHDASTRSRSVTAGSGGPAGSGYGGGVPGSSPGSAAGSSASSVTCDRCDGKHHTDRCPHYNKDREKHKDAWVNYGRRGDPKAMGGCGGNFVLKSARVVRQPGDGSCLFHSLSHGLQGMTSGQSLRREIAGFVQQNPSLKIAGDTLEDWVRWDANSSLSEYCRRIAVSGWGGGIEMAACSHLKGVNIHVYENAARAEFKRISCFDAPNAVRTIHVLYQGGVHYDALVPSGAVGS